MDLIVGTGRLVALLEHLNHGLVDVDQAVLEERIAQQVEDWSQPCSARRMMPRAWVGRERPDDPGPGLD